MRKIWTKEEDEFMIQNYPHRSSAEIARELNRSVGSVYSRADILKLNKTEEYLKGEYHQLISDNLRKVGQKSRFVPGQKVWNKGMKGLQIGGEATQFKKGQKPLNTKTDGHISVRHTYGKPYNWIRISNSNWDLLHRVVWRENFGEIPPGMNVAFKDSNTLNCDPENLFLITKKDNMMRNTIHQYPEDLKQAIRTITKLKKTIKSYEK